MADNIELPSGTGGAIVATDDDGTAHHQYVKLEFGADNTQTKVSSANPLPVIAASNSGVDIGDVTVNNGTGAQSVPVQGAAATDAAAAGNPVLIGGEFDDTTPNSVDEGDAGSIRMSANRNLYVTLRDAAGNERGLNIDANGDINVTGTVDLGTTDNGVLDAIQTATEATQAALETAGGLVVNLGANNDVTVTGTVTANLSATDNGVLDAIAASLALLDNAIATGNELQVDVVAALPAGDNNIGNVDAIQSGTWTVDLGATDNAVLDAIAADGDAIQTLLGTIDTDTGGILTAVQLIDNLVLAEDAAHQTGDPGIQMLAVRQSTQSDFAADGDYVPLSIDDDGGLRVSIVAGAGSGGTAAADDADFVAGTTSGTPAMGVYESTPSSVTDGDLGTVGITQTRALRTAVEGTVTVDLAGNNDVTVTSGTVTANLGATDTAALAAIETATEATQAALETAGGLVVNLGANNDVTVTGTVTANLSATDNQVLDDIETAVDGIETLIGTTNSTLTTIDGRVDGIEGLLTTIDADTGNLGAILTAVQVIDNPVLVDDAAFTPGTSSVMMSGFHADEGSTDSVNEGDAGAARMTLDRKVITTPYAHAAAGGASGYNNTDVQETDVEIKSGAGKIFSIYAWNLTDGPLWLKLHDALAANVTPGTTAPTYDLMIPANADSDGAGVVIPLPPMGLQFSTGITVYGSATRGTTAADVGTAGNMGVFITYA